MLGPGAGEDGDDGDFIAQHGSGVPYLGVFEEGLALEVGEVEGAVCSEEAGGCDKGFSFVVTHVGPFAEVGRGHLLGAKLRC